MIMPKGEYKYALIYKYFEMQYKLLLQLFDCQYFILRCLILAIQPSLRFAREKLMGVKSC